MYDYIKLKICFINELLGSFFLSLIYLFESDRA